MPRRPDFAPAEHKTVVSKPRLERFEGKSCVVVKVKCPRCKKIRTRPAREIRAEIKRPAFRGYCRQCALLAVAEGTHIWSYTKPKKNGLSVTGYRLVLPRNVAFADLPMFRKMQRCNQPVLEHRFVMAKHLGRPLTTRECVDHMNGNRSDNRIENLRLYVRGKNQPGSGPGHGTYYHEWQNAKARIRKLIAKIKKLKKH